MAARAVSCGWRGKSETHPALPALDQRCGNPIAPARAADDMGQAAIKMTALIAASMWKD
jgi:hypothetical protein